MFFESRSFRWRCPFSQTRYVSAGHEGRVPRSLYSTLHFKKCDLLQNGQSGNAAFLFSAPHLREISQIHGNNWEKPYRSVLDKNNPRNSTRQINANEPRRRPDISAAKVRPCLPTLRPGLPTDPASSRTKCPALESRCSLASFRSAEDNIGYEAFCPRRDQFVCQKACHFVNCSGNEKHKKQILENWRLCPFAF